jgi:hypothetical protein
MSHAGLDLSRRRLDLCLLDELGGRVEEGAVAPRDEPHSTPPTHPSALISTPTTT